MSWSGARAVNKTILTEFLMTKCADISSMISKFINDFSRF